MNRYGTWVAVVGLAALAGCFPEKRVLWSPDGRRAAVLGADGLYLCDEQGKLSPRLLDGAKRACWLPDSKQIVVASSATATKWSEIQGVFAPERRAAVVRLAERTRRDVLEHEGGWDSFEWAGGQTLSPGEAAGLLLCLRDTLGEGLPEKLGDIWQHVAEATATLWQLTVVDVSGGVAGSTRVIFRGFDELQGLRVAPQGGAVLFTSPFRASESDALRLYVLALEGTAAPRAVADYVCLSPDWTSDGTAVAYAAANAWGPKDVRLGSIARRAVADQSGALLGSFPDAEELAGLLFGQEMNVRCLPDGRIVFAALEGTLPAMSGDLPEKLGLFAIEPGKPTLARLLSNAGARRAPDGLPFFEVSPDFERLLLPGAHGELSVLTLKDGELHDIVPADGKESVRTVPTWRSPDEICFETPLDAEKGRPNRQIELVKFGLDGTSQRRVLSADWPESATRGWLLPDEKPQTQPSTAPAEK